MRFIKSIILMIISILILLFAVLAFQKLYTLQHSIYSFDPSQIDNIPELMNSKFQSIYVFFSITIIIAVLAFIYFAFIDISKEFKLAIETKRAKEEEIVKEDIDLGELEEEITESDIERKKRAKFNDIKNKIHKIYNTKGKTKTDVCEGILSLIGKEIEIVQGEIFLLKSENNEEYSTYELIATYAYFIPEEQKINFEYGEGLVGQVAKGQEMLYIDNVPENYIKVASGLGDSPPNNLLIIPIIKDQVTIGVLELASFKKIAESEIDLLYSIADEIGILFGEKMREMIQHILNIRVYKKEKEEAENKEKEEEKENLEETLGHKKAEKQNQKGKTETIDKKNPESKDDKEEQKSSETNLSESGKKENHINSEDKEMLNDKDNSN